METINQKVPMYPLRQIPSEAKIKKMVRKIVFGSHLHCPRCKSRAVCKSENRYRCRKCRRAFSLTSGTWLNNMKLSWQRFYLLLWCWLNHLPISQTTNMTALSELTIRKWYEKFRANITAPELFKPLSDIVQMDEAYFRGNAVIAAKDIKKKRIVMRVLPKQYVQKQNIVQFIVRHIKPGSTLQTDGGGVYRGIDKSWPLNHKRDIHSKWEFELTSEIEGLFGNLRTFIRRKYHHVTGSKLPEVVAEFEAFFNHPEIFKNPHQYLLNSLSLVPTC